MEVKGVRAIEEALRCLEKHADPVPLIALAAVVRIEGALMLCELAEDTGWAEQLAVRVALVKPLSIYLSASNFWDYIVGFLQRKAEEERDAMMRAYLAVQEDLQHLKHLMRPEAVGKFRRATKAAFKWGARAEGLIDLLSRVERGPATWILRLHAEAAVRQVSALRYPHESLREAARAIVEAGAPVFARAFFENVFPTYLLACIYTVYAARYGLRKIPPAEAEKMEKSELHEMAEKLGLRDVIYDLALKLVQL